MHCLSVDINYSDVLLRYFNHRRYRTISYEVPGCSVAVNGEVSRHVQRCFTVSL